MNTNSKHYETLNIQPWEIMEKNFTTEEFIAYLKGNIIKYTLRDKGQDLSDAEKIKHYAEKLIEVQKGRPVLVAEKPEEVAEAPLVKREKTYTYKVGDRVKIDSGWSSKSMKGTVIRTPVKELVQCHDCYIVELDEEENKGWEANLKDHLVVSDSAWFASEDDLKHITKEEPKKTLEPNKWYDAEDFTVDELKALLPVGTVVVVTKKHDNNRIVDLEEEKLLNTTIKNIGQRYSLHDTRVGITADDWWRRHFKIVKEN